MTISVRAGLRLLAFAVPLTLGAQHPEPEVERLADGVFAIVRREPIGLAVNANSLVVVGDSAVLVVDAQFTRAATLQTLRAIRGITALPVRYVVNTHWHDDHMAGNQVYQDSFPGVRFVLHENTRTDFPGLGGPNRIGTRDGAPPLVEKFQRQLDAGLGIDSTTVVPGERASMESALRIMRQYLAELGEFREAVAGDTVRSRWEADLGGVRVDVRWFGRGNTRGDLVVYVPSAGVVGTGDLVVAPVPFGFNSYPAEWMAVLDSVAALRPRMIVPGHGPVMRDLRYVRALRAALQTVTDSARVAVARQDSTAQVARRLVLDAERRALVGDDAWRQRLFDRFFRQPAIAAAMAQERRRATGSASASPAPPSRPPADAAP